MPLVRFTIDHDSPELPSGYLAETGVVATVFPADRSTEASWKEGRRTLSVSIGDAHGVQSFPDGRYLIECQVPGGEIWQREFTVAGAPLEVRLPNDHYAQDRRRSSAERGIGARLAESVVGSMAALTVSGVLGRPGRVAKGCS